MPVHELTGEHRTIRTRDGRVLTYGEYGDAHGRPVVLMHGAPGSRKGPRPRPVRLYPSGVRLIAYDRPGYGGSTRQIHRTVADAAVDLEDLADALRIERFAVAGRSGGAPHALACAALLPERITRVAALVTLAPRDLMGEHWYDHMTRHNQDWYRVAERGVEEYTPYVSAQMGRVRADPDSYVPYGNAALPPTDLAVIADYGIRSMFSENFSEGLRESIDGWIDDGVALAASWGVDPAKITVPVLLWHGTEDVFSPIEHSLWLARRIPRAEMRQVDGASHFDSVPVLPEVLNWLT